MKANDITELVFILDKSGSMAGLEGDTIGGFNAMIEKQKKERGRAYVTTILFDGRTERLHDRLSVDRVPFMTDRDYCAGGCTALYDAVGGAIDHIGGIHKYARRGDVPSKTLFVITTDGWENASRRYSRGRVKRMIERQKRRYGWEFIFLGANIDACAVGESIGIDRDHSADYRSDSDGTALNFEVISKAVSSVRCCDAPLSAAWKKSIEDDIRKRGRSRK